MPYLRYKNGIEYRPPNTGTRNNVAGENFSGSTAETIISQVLVPSNTFVIGDMIDVYTLLTKNTTGTSTVRLRIGTGGTTSDIVVATNVTAGTTTQWAPILRKYIVAQPNGSTYGFSGTTSSPTFVNESGAIEFFNLNWTKDNYISVTSQASALGTVVNVECIKLKRSNVLTK